MTGNLRDIWYSPLVGAYLLCKFAEGFAAVKRRTEPDQPNPCIALAFPALIMLMLPKYSDAIGRNCTSLKSWAERFVMEDRKYALFSLSDDIRKHHELVVKSLDAAFVAEILSCDMREGTICARRVPGLSEAVLGACAPDFQREFGAKAKRVGAWFANESPRSISSLLGVRF